MSESRRSFSSASSRDEALRRITKIVNNFLAKEELTPFREPVDWRGLELLDYPEVIKKQMDLGTIKRRLERNQYSCSAEVAHDIRLVWRNCMQWVAPWLEIDVLILRRKCSSRFVFGFDSFLILYISAWLRFNLADTMRRGLTSGTLPKASVSDSKIGIDASETNVSHNSGYEKLVSILLWWKLLSTMIWFRHVAFWSLLLKQLIFLTHTHIFIRRCWRRACLQRWRGGGAWTAWRRWVGWRGRRWRRGRIWR